VICAYNPNCSGGRAQEDHGLRPAQSKIYQDSILINKVDPIVYICNPSCAESHREEDCKLRLALGKKARSYLKNN
jgi:hypothetical protein